MAVGLFGLQVGELAKSHVLIRGCRGTFRFEDVTIKFSGLSISRLVADLVHDCCFPDMVWLVVPGMSEGFRGIVACEPLRVILAAQISHPVFA